MMDLTEYYVPNEKGILRDTFIAECERQGITPYSPSTLTDYSSGTLELVTPFWDREVLVYATSTYGSVEEKKLKLFSMSLVSFGY